ncbi:MAG: alkaline phosphatase family protein [Bacteroidetes bacterium]|nr:alkaline phosphatase family protein [Bacteroidota bacterium]
MAHSHRILKLVFVNITWAFLLILQPVLAQDTLQMITPDRVNSAEQTQKPYVILISVDGFRYDLAMRYQAKNLLNLSAQGVEATSMRPSFPSLTFPNHYSIITGLYPSHHGIVGNKFYDPARKQMYAIRNKAEVQDGTWYGGEPLWVLAEKQKMLSASFFWVGSESDIEKTRPTYYYQYSELFTNDRRLDILKDWLQLPEGNRPHFITFYFPEVDHAEHYYGVYSKQAEEAVHHVDSAIGKMNSMVAQLNLPVNFIFVSDHGFTNIDTVHTIAVENLIDTSKFIVAGESTIMHLYAKDTTAIISQYNILKAAENNYHVYLANEVPERWHYGKKDDRYGRIGDILISADMPFIFSSKGRKNAATHGFDNYTQEMQATFYAWGPAFKENFKINNFENINIYPLIAYILGLHFDANSIDGKLEVLKPILKESK